MSDILGKVFSIIFMGIATILAIAIILLRVDGVVENYVYNEATSFVDTCATTGKITPDNYENFFGKVYKLGKYKVEITYGQKVSYYDETTHTVVTEYKEIITDDIVMQMYGDGSTYPAPFLMETGDTIKVTVRKNGLSKGEQLLSFFIRTNSDNTIVANYSKTVGSNGRP